MESIGQEKFMKIITTPEILREQKKVAPTKYGSSNGIRYLNYGTREYKRISWK